jgi:membrane protease YdiL (CAAX protease family)
MISFGPYHFGWMPFGIQPWAIAKTINIIVAVIFYKVFRNYFGEHRFLRLRQENKIIKNVGIFCLVVLLLSLLVFCVDVLFLNYLWKPETTDFQDVFFTMTLPGIEEEIIYRGIFLGLLAAGLKSKKLFGGKITFHPGIWITGFFFGLAHGFRILPGWEIYWDWTDIWTSTVLSGAFFAWMTLKSKSIVTPILIHNAIFFIVALVDNLHPN